MDLYDPAAIRALLARHGHEFRKSLGQNFLISPEIARRIAETVEPDWGVVEIGPGHGALTAALCARAARVAAVELDRRLLPVLAETLAGFDHVELIQGDALRQDYPALCARALPGLVPAACANLPYNITTPAIQALLDARCFEQMTLMVQKEAGARLRAPAGTPDYGPLNILLAADYNVKTLCEVPADCFVPRPHVDSAVLSCRRRANPATPEALRPRFARLVRAAFAARRKTLANALEAAGFCGREEALAALAACGLDPRVRGEALEIGQFVALAEKIEVI